MCTHLLFLYLHHFTLAHTHTPTSHSTEPSPSTFLTPLAHNQGWVTPPLLPLDSSSIHSPLPLNTRTLSPHMPHQPPVSNLPASQGGNPTPATGHEPNQSPSPTHPPSGYYPDQLLQACKAYRQAGTKFHTCQSAAFFLEECAKQNLIPSGLKIRHTYKATLPTFTNVETCFNLILRQTERQLRETLLHHYQSASRSAEKQFHQAAMHINDLEQKAPPYVVHLHSPIYGCTMDNLAKLKHTKDLIHQNKLTRLLCA